MVLEINLLLDSEQEKKSELDKRMSTGGVIINGVRISFSDDKKKKNKKKSG